VKFSEDVRPITDLKTHAAEVVEHVQRTRRPVLLTRRGRGVAVVLKLEEYEELMDRANFVEAIQAGARAAEAGDLHPHEAALEILDGFGDAGGP
jgi:prevent-host-death family protein